MFACPSIVCRLAAIKPSWATTNPSPTFVPASIVTSAGADAAYMSSADFGGGFAALPQLPIERTSNSASAQWYITASTLKSPVCVNGHQRGSDTTCTTSVDNSRPAY